AGGTTWRGGKKYWLHDIRAYDLAADRWEDVGRLPEPIGYAVGVGTGDSLCVLGGSDGKVGSARCYRLRLGRGGLSIGRLPDLPEPRVYAAGAHIGGTLYVVGGGTDPNQLGTAATTLFALDLAAPERGWKTLPPLPGPARVIHTAAAARGRLYVFGGCRLDAQKVVRNLADAYCYSPRTNTWQRLPDAPASNRAWTAAGDGAGHVLLFGGFTATTEECAGKGDDFGFTAEVLRYDPAAHTYSPAGKLPAPNACAAPVRYGDRLMLCGGEPVKKQRADWVWLTDLR
ncbi:MAG: hypothetical protein KKI08_10935, partial [Armatimonadetes bacterium]|nr:hypothetical protein [Armatimonadota bacterium]